MRRGKLRKLCRGNNRAARNVLDLPKVRGGRAKRLRTGVRPKAARLLHKRKTVGTQKTRRVDKSVQRVSVVSSPL